MVRVPLGAFAKATAGPGGLNGSFQSLASPLRMSTMGRLAIKAATQIGQKAPLTTVCFGAVFTSASIATAGGLLAQVSGAWPVRNTSGVVSSSSDARSVLVLSIGCA